MKLTPPFILLEDRLTPGASARLYEHPVDVIRCDTADQIDDGFLRLEAALNGGLHAAGALAYELGHVLEPRLRPIMPTKRGDPLLWIGLFQPPAIFKAADVDAFFAQAGPPPPLSDLEPRHDLATHVSKGNRVLELISAGDVYQANLTFKLHFRYEGDPLSLYAALRAGQPTAHGGLAALGDCWVLSVSPELFLQVADRDAVSRPMKGTAARGGNRAEDLEAAQALLANPKDRAENLMITDLIRNDLARISEPGTVRVPDPFTLESHPTFHALTSTVTSRLIPDIGLRERLKAMFPCGSIVGAPKIRAAQVLSELEDEARGFYTGAIGSFGPDGNMKLNVAIRTAVIRRDGAGSYGVGGGVVADSDPTAEYAEARLKAKVLEDLAQDYGLVETLLWSSVDGFVRLSGHLGRLAISAAKLGFPFDRAVAEAKLKRLGTMWATSSTTDRRVRLLLTRSGETDITDESAPALDIGLARLGIANARLDAADPFLRHKTTRRNVYDTAAAEAEAAGWDEVLLLNRSGEVADASRHSVFAQVGDILITPPLNAGALPGVLREELVGDGLAVEGRLTCDDLAAAPALFIGNSLRGLRKARLAIATSSR